MVKPGDAEFLEVNAIDGMSAGSGASSSSSSESAASAGAAPHHMRISATLNLRPIFAMISKNPRFAFSNMQMRYRIVDEVKLDDYMLE